MRQCRRSANSNNSVSCPWWARLTPLSRLCAKHMLSVTTNTTFPLATARCTSIHRRTALNSLPVDDAGAPDLGQASAHTRGSPLVSGVV